MAYRMAPVSVTLNDLEGHSPVAGLFKCNPLIICVAFYQIQLTACSRGPSAAAGLLVWRLFGLLSTFFDLLLLRDALQAYSLLCVSSIFAKAQFSCLFVLDGGALLHRVRWIKGSRFVDVLQQYATYIGNKYGQHLSA